MSIQRTPMKQTLKRRDPGEAKARKLVRERSDGVCEVCGTMWATNMHHRKNRSQGGLWEASNLLHLCGSGTTGCHGWITEHVTEAVAKGQCVRSHQDPTGTAVWTRHGWVLLDNQGGIHSAESLVAEYHLQSNETLAREDKRVARNTRLRATQRSNHPGKEER